MRITEISQRPRIQETSYINVPVELLQESKSFEEKIEQVQVISP